ncbi:hypothetical protein [Pectinatus cerevisiiphilus]
MTKKGKNWYICTSDYQEIPFPVP